MRKTGSDSNDAKVAQGRSGKTLFPRPSPGIKSRRGSRTLIQPKSRRDPGMGIRAIKPNKGNTGMRRLYRQSQMMSEEE